MALTPRFSAQKFTGVLSRAMGTGAGGVQKALMHIGAQKALQSGVSTKDARQIMRKLQTSGAITDERGARDAFKRAERVANFASRVQQQQMRDERLQQYRTERSLADDIVQRNAHSVTAVGPQQRKTATSSIADVMKAKEKNQNDTGASSTSARSAPVQLAKPGNFSHASLQDIPFD